MCAAYFFFVRNVLQTPTVSFSLPLLTALVHARAFGLGFTGCRDWGLVFCCPPLALNKNS